MAKKGLQYGGTENNFIKLKGKVIMAKYIIRRIGMCIMVVVAAAIVIFTIMYFVPGDPVKIMMGADATYEMIEQRRTEMGLNDPYLVQLGRFLYNAFLRFDFGTSYHFSVPVMDELLARFPRTLILGVSCILVDVVISIPLGIWAALNHGRWQDRSCMIAAMACVSIPDFWLALMLIILFSLKLKWLPSYGIGSWYNYIMPVIAGSLHGIGSIARQMRSGMLDVIHSDFVVTARSKGLAEKQVVLKHMLPNSLIPVITVVGQHFGRCIAGTVIIEQIFSIPGVGSYMLTAVNNRDYPVVQGVVIFLAAATAIVMLVVDLIYAAVDPRIKSQYAGKRG